MGWTGLPLAVAACVVTVVQALPLQWVKGFVENRGQWDVPCTYLYARPGLTVGVFPTALLFDAYEQHVESLPHGWYELEQRRIHRRGHVVRLEFEGATPALGRVQLAEPAVLHFFRGRSAERWYHDIPVARMVELLELYPGITLRLWALPEGPRYDFILQPGADPEQLRMRVVGAEHALVALQGRELRLFGAYGLLILHSALRAYQEIEGQHREVPVRFVLEAAEAGTYRLGFVLGEYSRQHPLIIDPIVYATCVGASADERIPSLQRLPDGSLLSVVQTEELTFRMTPGAYDSTYNGLTDAVVLKLDPTLHRLLFATYLGGSGSELPSVVGIEAGGEILIGGSTNSPDFPVRNPYQQQLRGGVDLFVARLTARGSQLRWSTYVGGSRDDIATTGSVRRDGIVVLAGRTQSADFPTVSGAYQRTYAGNWDVFLTALSNTGASLSFSTFLGGSDNETAWSVYTDPEGYTYLCGETSSSNFPNYPVPTFANPGNRPYDRDYNGGARDAFVAKFRPTSATLQYCTFLGGNQEDYATGIVARDNGEVWVVGVTRSANFPVSAVPYQGQLAGGADGFLCRFTSQGIGVNALLYSSFLGGSADDEPRIVLEFNNAPIVIGWTRSGNFPVTPDAQSPRPIGGQDLFITIFPDLQPFELSYSTFVGTLQDERPLAAVVDARGDFYLAGETNSLGLCRAAEGFQNSAGGGWDAFIVKFVRASLTLFSPRGGERFCAGSAVAISWNASGVQPGDTFRLELSPDRQQWTVIASVTGTTTYLWTISSTQPSGRYWLRVVHAASGLADVSDSAFSIAQPPSITQQPPDTVRLCVGDTLVLEVSAAGDSLKYQWYRGNTPLPGAQQAVLRLPVTGREQAGQYSVRVYGSCPPELSSRITTVMVEEPPRITRAPRDVTVDKGKPACFSVSAAGGTTRRYQWLKNGAPIPGATDSTFCIAAVAPTDTGAYQCVVWNRCGSDTSAPGRLQISVGVSERGLATLQLRWLPSSEAPQRLQIVSPEPWTVRSALYSVLGVRVAEGTTELPVAGLPSGVYWLVVESGHSARWVTAVVLLR